MRGELWVDESSFLVHGLSKNGLVINTPEQEHATMLVFKLPTKTIGYVAQMQHDMGLG
jgi:hypothetical protein